MARLILAAAAATTLNHSVFAAAYFPIWLWAAWLGFLVACWARAEVRPSPPLQVGRPSPTALAVGALAVIPAGLPLAVSWDREFGFGGDSSFHIGVAFRLALWWASAPFSTPSPAFDFAALDAVRADPSALLGARAVVFALGLGLVALAARRWPRAAVVLGALALFAWGAAETAREFRYPALAYHAVFPFLLPAVLAGAPELAFRLSSLAALLAWLFVLRPVLLKRWPDAPILAAAAFLFWNDGFLATFDAAFLEPWAIGLLALAVEARVRGGVAGAPLACVLVGFAAAAKEPAIFVLPFVWLSALPWRDPRGSGRDATLAALAAGLPFLSYFAVNRAIGQVRSVVFDAPDAATLMGLGEYAARFAQSGGGFALVGLALALAALVLWRDRAGALAFAGAAVLLFLFFALERASLAYAGLYRFLWLVFPMLCAGLLARSGRVAIVLAASICAAQAPGVYAAVERARADYAARGFAEYFDAPLVFPIKSLFREAGLPSDRRVVVLRPDAAMQPGAAMGRQGAVLDFVDEAPCRCSAEAPAVLALAMPDTGYWANGAAPKPGMIPGPERVAAWRAKRAALPACEASLRATCARVLTRSVGDQPVAVLGVAAR